MDIQPTVVQRIILILGGLLLLFLSTGPYGMQSVISVTISTILLFLSSTKRRGRA